MARTPYVMMASVSTPNVINSGSSESDIDAPRCTADANVNAMLLPKNTDQLISNIELPVASLNGRWLSGWKMFSTGGFSVKISCIVSNGI